MQRQAGDRRAARRQVSFERQRIAKYRRRFPDFDHQLISLDVMRCG
jgi:transposase-like protein